MTAEELFETLKQRSGAHRAATVDGIIAGDPRAETTAAAACFKATSEVIEKTAAAGIPLLICHEPVFASGESRERAVGYDLKKWELIDRTGLTILRFHDYAHETQPDFIHRGFLRRIGLDIRESFPRESLGVSRYLLQTPLPAREISRLTEERLGARFPRIIGAPDAEVRYVCLALGSIGFAQARLLEREDCDMVITGEIGEVNNGFYIRDLVNAGLKKSMLLLGHYTAEYAGMQEVAETVSGLGIPCGYIDCGEVY